MLCICLDMRVNIEIRCYLISSLHYTIYILHCLFVCLSHWFALSTMCLMPLYPFFIVLLFFYFFLFYVLFFYLFFIFFLRPYLYI